LIAQTAVAEQCPAESLARDDIVAGLNSVPHCNAAMTVFQACQMGSTADIQSAPSSRQNAKPRFCRD